MVDNSSSIVDVGYLGGWVYGLQSGCVVDISSPMAIVDVGYLGG